MTTKYSPEEIKNAIVGVGKVTAQIQEKYFQGMGFKQIRDALEEIELDRHLGIELRSCEIALKTPFGILMQIRPSDKNQLGMWGGVLNKGEDPYDGAIRELFEETGIKITKEQLKFVEENVHEHVYANGDKAIFNCYRFVVEFDYVPKIQTDEESVGAFMVVHTILDHQQSFIKKILNETE